MKFSKIFRKELKDLITPQFLFSIILSLVLFSILGDVMQNTINDTVEDTNHLTICDEDNTELTKNLVDLMLKQDNNIDIKMITLDKNRPIQEQLEENDIKSLCIFEKGFTDAILNNKQGKISIINNLQGMGLSDQSPSLLSSMYVSLLNETIKSIFLSKEYDLDTIKLLEDPIDVCQKTFIKEKYTNASVNDVSDIIKNQTTFLPVIIFILIIYASQMIINSISTEKIDKTLETLLSTPVSRTSILAAKMLSTALISGINAAVYLLGFKSFMNKLSSFNESDGLSTNDIMTDLGLKLTTGDYILIGLQMFLTIMIVLSISLILGALAKDAKSATALIAPITITAMIPYFISMIFDINSLSLGLKIAISIIPFTHTFTAINNIMFDNMTMYWSGLIYQVIFLAVCMFFAVRVFMTDKIFTISLNLTQKRKFNTKSSLAKLFKK